MAMKAVSAACMWLSPHVLVFHFSPSFVTLSISAFTRMFRPFSKSKRLNAAITRGVSESVRPNFASPLCVAWLLVYFPTTMSLSSEGTANHDAPAPYSFESDHVCTLRLNPDLVTSVAIAFSR
jgi:hypothetical protein